MFFALISYVLSSSVLCSNVMFQCYVPMLCSNSNVMFLCTSVLCCSVLCSNILCSNVPCSGTP